MLRLVYFSIKESLEQTHIIIFDVACLSARYIELLSDWGNRTDGRYRGRRGRAGTLTRILDLPDDRSFRVRLVSAPI